MSQPVVISICIPAYKNAAYLKRLLDSISIQTYKSFEVVVTDDSPEDEVHRLCQTYQEKFALRYIKNQNNLNTPENWNEGLRNAKGKWIKIMHDDDWFSGTESLWQFAEAARAHPQVDFFFSSYTNIYEGTGRTERMRLSAPWKNALQNPGVLLAKNVVGPPSVTMHKNSGVLFYDKKMKYIVDIDFYMRYLENSSWFYIDQSLINVGINPAQVTKYTFGVAGVHLKEALQLLEKQGAKSLRNIYIFDAWWRLLRNFSIKSKSDLEETGFTGTIPPLLEKITAFQNKLNPKLLKNGLFSKSMMLLCYLSLRNTIK